MSTYYQSTQSLSIQAPAEKIYEVLTDWAARAQWRHGIEIAWDEGSKAFLNQRVTFRVKGALLSYSVSFRITGLEPPRRFYMEYTGKPLKGRAAVEINPEEKGCRVEFHWMKVEPEGIAARIVFGLGMGMRFHQIRTMETLRMLKEFLEQE